MVYSSDLVLELISTGVYILSNLAKVRIPAFLLLSQLYLIRLEARKASFTSRVEVSNSNTPYSSNDIVWLLFLDLSCGLSTKFQSSTRVHLQYVCNDVASSLHNKHLAIGLFGAYTFKINISPLGRPANLTHYARYDHLISPGTVCWVKPTYIPPHSRLPSHQVSYYIHFPPPQQRRLPPSIFYP
jgi:hypothetical protein